MDTVTTKVGAGVVETSQPDAATLAALDGKAEVAIASRQTAALDGRYQPAESKLYTEYMKIAYGVGFGAELGCPQGSLVLGKKDVIAGPKQALVSLIVGAHGFWREWKEYDPASPPRDFPTEAQALAAGLRTHNPPYGSGLPLRNCAPAVHLDLFVRLPESGTSSMAFTILLDGQRYAAVRFTVDRGQYLDIEKVLAQLPQMDAAERGVSPKEGRMHAFFVTFTTAPEVNRITGKTRVRLYLNPLLDKATNKPVRAAPQVHADLAGLARSLAEVAAEQSGASLDPEQEV